jgi:hypothetical protein
VHGSAVFRGGGGAAVISLLSQTNRSSATRSFVFATSYIIVYCPQEQQLYYKEVTEACVGSSEAKRAVSLENCIFR